MHPDGGGTSTWCAGFPRRRGDAPDGCPGDLRPSQFPPQARGCTVGERYQHRGDLVSPAGAGMHLSWSYGPPCWAGFPRRRGDAPPAEPNAFQRWVFPPQARGCTAQRARKRVAGAVSPAGAGMHRTHTGSWSARRSFPRRRGDAPGPPGMMALSGQFPPQARGCTSHPRKRQSCRAVSPAGAGMHPRSPSGASPSPRFPRRRGDAPNSPGRGFAFRRFPPQARGCTHGAPSRSSRRRVSPAGAGMHRKGREAFDTGLGFPRRRGDAPDPAPERGGPSQFPPQARGCTLRRRACAVTESVSPAGAGMHRRVGLSGFPACGFPRRRGDAPWLRDSATAQARFPPQARGCTPSNWAASPIRLVSPAGAGMHRTWGAGGKP